MNSRSSSSKPFSHKGFLGPGERSRLVAQAHDDSVAEPSSRNPLASRVNANMAVRPPERASSGF